jgi:hypothetical protein
MRIAGGVAVVVAVLAGFWLLVLAPKRADLSAANAAIVQAESRRDAAVAGAGQAEQAKARYQSDYATVARLGKAVPADDDVASLLYQLETLARANKIDFRAVKLTATAPAPAAAAPVATSGDDKGKDAEATAAAAAAPAVSQAPPGSVIGPAGLLTVPFTFSFDGDYLRLQRLLEAINALAKNDKGQISVHGRLLTIDGFSLAASAKGFPRLKAIVSATAYIAPETAGAAQGAGG